jgi:hypothetical protein
MEDVHWAPLLLLFALLSFYTYRKGRYWWSGFVLPLVLLKPQVGLALFFAMIAFALLNQIQRRWWQGIVLGFLVWWGLSLLIFPSWPLGWLEQIRRYSDEDQNSIMAFSVAGGVISALGVAVGVLAFRRRDPEIVLGAVLALGMLFLPMRSIYNQTVFLLPLVLLAARQPGAVVAVLVTSWSIFVLLFLRIDAINATVLAFYAPLLIILLRAVYRAPTRSNAMDRQAFKHADDRVQ